MSLSSNPFNVLDVLLPVDKRHTRRTRIREAKRDKNIITSNTLHIISDPTAVISKKKTNKNTINDKNKLNIQSIPVINTLDNKISHKNITNIPMCCENTSINQIITNNTNNVNETITDIPFDLICEQKNVSTLDLDINFKLKNVCAGTLDLNCKQNNVSRLEYNDIQKNKFDHVYSLDLNFITVQENIPNQDLSIVQDPYCVQVQDPNCVHVQDDVQEREQEQGQEQEQEQEQELVDKFLKINRLREKEKDTIDKIEENKLKKILNYKQINKLRDEILEWESLYSCIDIDTLNHESTWTEKLIDDKKLLIKNLISDKNCIVNKLRLRAELRGDPITNKYNNTETKLIDKSLEEIQINITILEQKIKSIHELNNEIMQGINKNILLQQIILNNNNLDNELILEENKLHEIQKLILEEVMKPKYITFVKDHMIDYDSDDDFDIFRQANKYYHWLSLLGYKVSTKCIKRNRNCNESVELKLGDYNDPYNKIIAKCECGKSRWQYENPPDDLTKYNLDSIHIYGSIN